MFQYICLNPIADAGLRLFSENYEKVEQIEEADAVLVRSASMHELALGSRLMAIARAGAGVNHIPLEECTKRGIVVFNTPGANANGVKELVLAAMLYASRDLLGGIEWCLKHQGDKEIAQKAEKEKKKFAGTEIAKKKLGVIGLGAIGTLVANASVELGMEVYGYDPYLSVDRAWILSEKIRPCTDIEKIYQTCDFISLHLPLTEQTKHMVNADAIAKMKSNAVLLNFSRDLLVEESAIVKALEEGHIKHYVTDFANPVIIGKKGCIVTPHLGASTVESEENCAVMAVRELQNYLEDGTIINSVNFPNCTLGKCKQQHRVAIFYKKDKKVPEKIETIINAFAITPLDKALNTKGEYGYLLMDIDTYFLEDVVKQIKSIDGVLKVRIIK